MAGGITQRVLDRFLDWSESVLSPAFLSGLSLSDVLLIVTIIIGCLFIAIGVLKSRPAVSKPKTSFDPRFKHVSARLFYPPKRRWHKIRVRTKHWWEMWKQTPSRHKLILVKDLKKAYWVGIFAWNLIIEDEIHWFSEEDQDLDQWCKREGYTLFPDDGDEDKLLEPYFFAEIVNKKEEYRRGDSVIFRTCYRGELTNGFFDNEISPPEGEVFSNGQGRAWSWAPDTLEDGYANTKGKLNGYVNCASEWSWSIPDDAPIGKYEVYMRVYNHFGTGKRPVTKEKQETITIVSSRRIVSAKGEKTEKLDISVVRFSVDLSSFDKSFKALQQATQPKTKELLLDEFQNKLHSLCYDFAWNDEVKDRIVKVLEYIPKELSDDQNVACFLLYLAIIVNRYGEYTINIVREKFLEELEKMYNDPIFETNSQILGILQKLHQYGEEYIMKLVNDAGSTSQWSDSRFDVLAANIEFWELNRRNKEAYEKVLQCIRQKMDDAEKNRDEKIHGRFKKPYELAKRY